MSISKRYPARTRIAAALFATAVLIGSAALLVRPEPIDSTRVWRIGTDNTPPYHYLDSRGEPQGMIADVVREAARRSGIRLSWGFYPAGPSVTIPKKEVDLWPLLSVALQTKDIHLTEPYLQNVYVALSLDRDIAHQPATAIRRVSVAGYTLVAQVARWTFPSAQIIASGSRTEAFRALCRGESEAFLTEARAAQYMVLNRPPGCESLALFSSGFNISPTSLGIASTPEARRVAERLRMEIDRMLADGTMARLMRPWNYFYSGEAETIFGEKAAISAKRISILLAAVLAVLSALLLSLLIRVRRASRAALAANHAKSQFLASMSHEIRTPLNGILGISQALEQTLLDADQRECVEILTGTGRTLLGIVNDLLDLARVERGQVELSPAPVNPLDLIQATLRVFQIQARGKGLGFEWSGLERLPPLVMVDGPRLRQIISNLVGNAVKFTENGGVTVAAATMPMADGAWLHLTVTDTGIGIPKAAQERLFEKFYQADTSIHQRFGGTGLGLAIARELARAMGGDIRMESTPGRGSSFLLSVPLPFASTGVVEKTEVRKEGPAPPASILLVEDNPINQRVAEKLLTQAGHTIVSATDGHSAIRQWRERQFDLVLMDCQMPGMDGYAATREIRKLEPEGARIPIVALTAAAMKGEEERCLAAGMDDYLTKPIDLVELNRVLIEWLPKARSVEGLRSPRRDGTSPHSAGVRG